MTLITSGFGKKRKKEDTATKHYMLLLSVPWEHTIPEATTAKCSGWHPDTWSLSFSKALQLGAAGTAPPTWAKGDRILSALSAGSGDKTPSYP